MSNELWRWVIAIVVFAHGVGHILFMPILSSTLRLTSDGLSWLLSGVLGDVPTRWLASTVALVAIVLFVGAAAGLVGQAAWWRPLAIAGALISAALVVVMWDGIPTSSAAFALAFDAVVLVALLLAHWPSEELVMG
jgi:hypothetical protein